MLHIPDPSTLRASFIKDVWASKEIHHFLSWEKEISTQKKIQTKFFKKWISVSHNPHQRISLDDSKKDGTIVNLSLHRLSDQLVAGFKMFYLITAHNECLMMEEGKEGTFIYFTFPLWLSFNWPFLNKPLIRFLLTSNSYFLHDALHTKSDVFFLICRNYYI